MHKTKIQSKFLYVNFESIEFLFSWLLHAMIIIKDITFFPRINNVLRRMLLKRKFYVSSKSELDNYTFTFLYVSVENNFLL